MLNCYLRENELEKMIISVTENLNSKKKKTITEIREAPFIDRI